MFKPVNAPLSTAALSTSGLASGLGGGAPALLQIDVAALCQVVDKPVPDDTASSDSGQPTALRLTLQDPQGYIPFAIVNQWTPLRLLTTADFAIACGYRASDGTLWLADALAPCLLHVDGQGVVLAAPVPLPTMDWAAQTITSPNNPYYEEGSALRIMHTVAAHARQHGCQHVPVFSPHHAMLTYQQGNLGADANAHYARGQHGQPGLKVAVSDIFPLARLQAAGYPVITWTVNDANRMRELLKLGVSGLISDRPDVLYEVLTQFEGGRLLTATGLIDATQFDAQGHRGGRDLRPENTLPAFEVALDYLMTTIETDSGITADGVPMLMHDPYLEYTKCRRADGKPYQAHHELLIKQLTQAEIQNQFIADKLIRGQSQSHLLALSPVAVQFAQAHGFISPYIVPSLQNLFDFVAYYADYYQHGAGKTHHHAPQRALNAQRVRFNVETKINPRQDEDAHQHSYNERTVDYQTMTEALIAVILRNQMQHRTDIQSFDFRTLLHVQQHAPFIRTVYLWGDSPIYDDPQHSSDGTNLQDEQGRNTPWLAGLYWPYRQTRALGSATTNLFHYNVQAIATDISHQKLYPVLEIQPMDPTASPTPQAEGPCYVMFEWDRITHTFTDRQFHRYLPAGTALKDTTVYVYDAVAGLVTAASEARTDNGTPRRHQYIMYCLHAASTSQPASSG